MHIPAYICDAVRTPFRLQDGVLSPLRLDELGAMPITALMVRNPDIDWEQLSDVLYGCAYPAMHGSLPRIFNQLADLPQAIPAAMTNRFFGSGLDAIGNAARFIKSGEISMLIAGGVESMSQWQRLAKEPGADASAENLKSGNNGSTVLGELGYSQYGSPLMAQDLEKLAQELKIDRRSQDRFAYASHRKAYAAQQNACFEPEITPVTIASKSGEPTIVTEDEITSRISSATLAGMDAVVGGTITAGNSAAAADGACALLLACENTAHKFSLMPKARILGMAVAGVSHDAMGIAPAVAARKALVQTGLSMEEFAVIELDEMYAAQAIAVLRDWGLQDDDPRVNPNGGSIALGHAPGATGARMVTTAMYQLHRKKERYALCTMYAGAGQGIALIIERV